ncbi:hypothetical protein IF1G_10649 [Cordyceps javanica]|uniref:Uncharacterized protein n=1 Tax=Cordyceps javanica TaxID=43265 RepID=A0A545UML1_9HYPO|nr:hypothetical protein IF1G_10649 [Cordyceps javanica]
MANSTACQRLAPVSPAHQEIECSDWQLRGGPLGYIRMKHEPLSLGAYPGSRTMLQQVMRSGDTRVDFSRLPSANLQDRSLGT